MSEPLITIITTAYNAERFLPASIDSVLRQTYANWELLIADDASTDHSAAVISEYASKDSRIKVSHNRENAHYLRTRNRLFAMAVGEYITLLDADDMMEPTRLVEQLRFMQQNPELAMCGCLVKYIDENGIAIKTNHPKPALSHAEILRSLPIYNPFTGSTIFIKTSVLREFGGYRDFFHGLCSEDYDLVSRVAEKYPCAILDQPLYVYRQFEDSTSRKNHLINPYKKFSGEIARWFIQQRVNGGKDALERGDRSAIETFVMALLSDYQKDPSKHYIDLVSSHLYSGLKSKALKAAFKAIVANPIKIYNYRTFVYTLKQLVKKS